MAPIAALGCELRAAAVGCGVISSPIPTPLPTKTQISAAEWSVPSGRMRNGRAAGFDGSRSDRTCATCHSGQPCAEAKKVSLTMAPCFTSTSSAGMMLTSCHVAAPLSLLHSSRTYKLQSWWKPDSLFSQPLIGFYATVATTTTQLRKSPSSSSSLSSSGRMFCRQVPVDSPLAVERFEPSSDSSNHKTSNVYKIQIAFLCSRRGRSVSNNFMQLRKPYAIRRPTFGQSMQADLRKGLIGEERVRVQSQIFESIDYPRLQTKGQSVSSSNTKLSATTAIGQDCTCSTVRVKLSAVRQAGSNTRSSHRHHRHRHHHRVHTLEQTSRRLHGGGSGRPRVPTCLAQDTLLCTSEEDGLISSDSSEDLSKDLSKDLGEDSAVMEVSNWSSFSEQVSGEWDGYSANFLNNGEPLDLPESVVPQAFREWEVRVCDWQTQCPTLATTDRRLLFKIIRLLPTVGCEADAATRYDVIEKEVGGGGGGGGRGAMGAFKNDGSFIINWERKDLAAGNLKNWTVEHCFVGDVGDVGDDRVRIRILQELERPAGEKKMDSRTVKVKSLTVFRERWEGAWRNGESFGGCGTGKGTFAEGKRLDSSAVEGRWRGESWTYGVTSSGVDGGGEDGSNMFALRREGVVDLSLDSSSIEDHTSLEETGVSVGRRVCMPAGVWTRVIVKKDGNGDGDGSEDGGGLVAEAGWLLEEGRMAMSVCEYDSSGDIKNMSIVYATRAD